MSKQLGPRRRRGHPRTGKGQKRHRGLWFAIIFQNLHEAKPGCPSRQYCKYWRWRTTPGLASWGFWKITREPKTPGSLLTLSYGDPPAMRALIAYLSSFVLLYCELRYVRFRVTPYRKERQPVYDLGPGRGFVFLILTLPAQFDKPLQPQASKLGVVSDENINP